MAGRKKKKRGRKKQNHLRMLVLMAAVGIAGYLLARDFLGAQWAAVAGIGGAFIGVLIHSVISSVTGASGGIAGRGRGSSTQDMRGHGEHDSLFDDDHDSDGDDGGDG